MLDVAEAVKDYLKRDKAPKGFTVHFPNGERQDIIEDNLDPESVRFTESLCSQQYLKFGLTESSAIEFETIGIENIADMEIECSFEVIVDGMMHSIPLGRFVVESCPRNHEAMTRRKVTAYTKSMSASENDYEAFKRSIPDIYDDKMTVYMDEYIAAMTGSVGSGFTLDSTMYPASGGTLSSGRYYFRAKKGNTYYQALVFGDSTTRTGNTAISMPDKKTSGAEEYKTLYQFNLAPSDDLKNVRNALVDVINGYLDALEAAGYDRALYYSPTGSSSTRTQYTNASDIVRLLTKESGCARITYMWEGVNSGTSRYVWQYYYTMAGEVLYPDDDKSGKKVGNCTYSSYNEMTCRVTYSPGITTYNWGSGNVNFDEHQTAYALVLKAEELADVSLSGILYGCTSALRCLKDGSCWMRFYNNRHTKDEELTCEFTKTGTSVINLYNSQGAYVDTEGATFEDALDGTGLVNGFLELNALFGNQQRDGSYALIPLSKANPIRITPSEYRSMWWDEYDIAPVGSVKYKYAGDQVAVYQFGDGLSTYDMTDNYLLQNLKDATPSMINAMLDEFFIPNIGDIAFTPVELTMRGLPYLEDGDYLEIETPDGTVVGTYIMQHTISGIQSLTDDIESQGGEIISR